MLLGKTESIDDLIIKELAVAPNLSAQELQERVMKHTKKKSMSVPGWYKAINRLLRNTVIVKQGKKHSLNVTWVVQMKRWASTLQNTYIDHAEKNILELPIKEGQKIKFEFNDLLSMDTFWSHLLVRIASQCKTEPIIYAYNPHFWFYLANNHSEHQYNQSMQEFRVQTYMLVGANTFLDKWNAQFFDESFKYWLSPKLLFKDICKAYNYFDGYFIEITMDKSIAERLDGFFRNTQSLSDIEPLALIEIFQAKAPCGITVSKSIKKGEMFKKKALSYFH